MIKEYFTKYLPHRTRGKVLYLCSRNIQPGDKVYPRDNLVDGYDLPIADIPDKKDIQNYQAKGFFRIIGEVSSAAIWVTEDMEFNVEDLGWLCDDGSGDIIPFVHLSENMDDEDEDPEDYRFDDIKNAIIAIRSPLSLTFH